MRVIGIDPAPKKPAMVFDGQGKPHGYAFPELRHYLSEVHQGNGKVLICWDAPLSGPRHTESDGPFIASDYSMRPIDAFFGRQQHGFKAPPGISVLPYSSCSHWAISRALLGLPRVGPFDTDWGLLPFFLISSKNDFREREKLIAEVHPALALWLWCRHDWPSQRGWKYKGDKEMVKSLWEVLTRKLASQVVDLREREIFQGNFIPADDDELDAIVAWLLGFLWLRGDSGVTLLGDRRSGSLLLPAVSNLKETFAGFLGEESVLKSGKVNP